MQTPSRVQDLLARHPRPTAPAQAPWEMSASSLITPFLPGSLTAPAVLVNRLGRIHLSPYGLAIDQKAVIPWQQIAQVHTRPAFELVTETLIERALARATFLIKLPGKAWATDLVAQKARDAVMSVLQVALSGNAPSLAFDLPVAVVHQNGRKQAEMNPGVLSTALLALPGVSEAILHTAALNAVPVIRHPAQTWVHVDRAAQLVADRIRRLTTGAVEEAPALPPQLPPLRRGREYTG
ncbi:hypothetical protein HPO96_18515 [Kribbella sandramycini]|uniref:Uncharacterized protein n=1 Tax=Kribbella sandramycini TaxID=60450 RepID=A0A7Y4P0U0_9ACTN|nr:hypothetical protein [Kribbella sandramycini]MBB6564539.1 hypothetical protein [Kribbella sandramycini]NOL42243.1 hypothetical protein [Kribbella sandramycini]